MRCPHCLSQKPLTPADELPRYLRVFGQRLSCDACLHHYFFIRLVGIFIPIPEPRRSRLA